MTKELYIGFTSDIKKRLVAHNSGATTSTKRQNGQWEVVYLEIFRVKEDAIKREYRLKHHGRAKQELLKRIENSLNKS